MKYKYWKSFHQWQCSGLPGIINSEAVLLQFCALDVLMRLPGSAVRPAAVACWCPVSSLLGAGQELCWSESS